MPYVIAFRNRPKQSSQPPQKQPQPTVSQPNTVLDTAERRKRKAIELDEDPVTSTVIKGKGRAVEPSSNVTELKDLLSTELDDPMDTEPAISTLPEWPHRRRSETVEAFLTRLRPSSSHFSIHGPWLWMHNYNLNRSARTPHYDESLVKGLGFSLLDEYKAFEDKTRAAMPDKAQATITRKLTPEKQKLEAALRKTAVDLNCVSGKWMLFPHVDDIDRIWRAVCKGVDDGKLGPTAKIATNGQDARSLREENLRLICVYTRDFSDQKDVRRVLDALIELGLVKRPADDAGNGIYYKCDAWTLWELGSGNDYKIKASMYGSKEMLSGGKDRDNRRKR